MGKGEDAHKQNEQYVTRIVSFLPQVSLIHLPCTVLWNLPACFVLNPSKGWVSYWFIQFGLFSTDLQVGLASSDMMSQLVQNSLLDVVCMVLLFTLWLLLLLEALIHRDETRSPLKSEVKLILISVKSYFPVFGLQSHPCSKFSLNNHYVTFKLYLSMCQNPAYWCEQRVEQCPLRPFWLGDLKSQRLFINEQWRCCGHLKEAFLFILPRPVQRFRVIKSRTEVPFFAYSGGPGEDSDTINTS